MAAAAAPLANKKINDPKGFRKPLGSSEEQES